MKIYIAGKITGESRASVAEKFASAMCKLKSAGHLPFNPSVLPDYEKVAHEDYMHICYAMIDVCDAIYMLKDWQTSAGARAELQYAAEWKKIFRLCMGDRMEAWNKVLDSATVQRIRTYSAFNDPQSKHLMIQTALEAGAEIGKREICSMGLALQSDMDKTIKQNMELKKILDDYRDFIAENKLQEEFKRFLKEVEK